MELHMVCYREYHVSRLRNRTNVSPGIVYYKNNNQLERQRGIFVILYQNKFWYHKCECCSCISGQLIPIKQPAMVLEIQNKFHLLLFNMVYYQTSIYYHVFIQFKPKQGTTNAIQARLYMPGIFLGN